MKSEGGEEGLWSSMRWWEIQKWKGSRDGSDRDMEENGAEAVKERLLKNVTGQAAGLEKRKKRRGATSGKIKYRNVRMLIEGPREGGEEGVK